MCTDVYCTVVNIGGYSLGTTHVFQNQVLSLGPRAHRAHQASRLGGRLVSSRDPPAPTSSALRLLECATAPCFSLGCWEWQALSWLSYLLVSLFLFILFSYSFYQQIQQFLYLKVLLIASYFFSHDQYHLCLIGALIYLDHCLQMILPIFTLFSYPL